MNQKVSRGILLVLAVVLLIGMGYQFMPGMNGLNLGGQKGTPAFTVNGQTVTVEELETMRRGNQVLSSTDTGVMGDDFKTYMVANAIQRKLVEQASSDIKVSRADVNAEVDKVRESNNLKDNKAWTDALQGAGLTDASYREQVRQGLTIQRKADELKKTAPAATEAEAKLYYDLNNDKFMSDPRIVGRQIVLTDEAKAKALLTQLKAGADFAKLATENSTDADTKGRGGALGALENGSPRPVAQVALPAEVGAAAFALPSPGLTDVIKSGGKFYIVKVEKLVPPSVKPFEEAKVDATTAVTEQKQNATLEAWVKGLEKDVKVEFKDANWKVTDPTVATVSGQNIPYSELLNQVVPNDQVASILQQMPAETAAQLVNGMLKPQIVQQLISGYAAPVIAKKLNLALTGNQQQMVAGLVAYGARDVKVTDADIQAFYTQNIKQFESPASATVNEASFKDKNQALAFRTDWKGTGSFTQAATKAGGTVSERGAVTNTEQDATLSPELKTAVFNAKTLKAAGEGSLTDVIKVGERYAVGYVTDLKPTATQPLSAVRSQLEPQVLANKKNAAGQAFLTKQIAELKPVDKLADVLAAQAKRVEAATPKVEVPKTDGTGATKTPATPATPTPATPTPATPADK